MHRSFDCQLIRWFEFRFANTIRSNVAKINSYKISIAFAISVLIKCDHCIRSNIRHARNIFIWIEQFSDSAHCASIQVHCHSIARVKCVQSVEWCFLCTMQNYFGICELQAVFFYSRIFGLNALLSLEASVKFHPIIETVQSNGRNRIAYKSRIKNMRMHRDSEWAAREQQQHLCKFIGEIKFYVQVSEKYFI